MKKFVKGCLIAALVLLILGVSMVAVVALVGDKSKIEEAVRDATDGKVEINLSSWENFGIHIVGEWEGRYDINDASVFDKNHEVWEGDMKKTQINQSVVDELDIQIGGNTLDIKVSEDNFYHIEQKGNGKLQAYEEQGVLHVKSIMNEVLLGGRMETKIVLYVPKETDLRKINVDAGAGKIEACGLKGKEVKISVEVGDIEWDALSAESLQVEIGAGKILTKNALIGDLAVSLGAGECEVQGEVQGNVYVNCAAGNVFLAHRGSEDEFNYELNCTVGDIQLGKETYSGLNKQKSIDNNASKTMDISVAAGVVEVKFE